MLELTTRLADLRRDVIEDEVVCLGIVDLMPGPFCAAVQTGEGYALAKLTVHVPALLLHIRTGLRADYIRWVFSSGFHHVRVIELSRILAYGTLLTMEGASDAVMMPRICIGIRGCWRWNMMLEE